MVGLRISVRILGCQGNRNLQGCKAMSCHFTDGKIEAQKGKGPMSSPRDVAQVKLGGSSGAEWDRGQGFGVGSASDSNLGLTNY